jgi:DNA-directed RNA polymerase specialized sigma24 family protein
LTASGFTDFVREAEPRLRRALVAAFGVDVGADATAEALAYGWEHWELVSAKANPAGYLFGVGRNKARRVRSRRVAFPVPPEGHELWVEPGLPAALAGLSQKQRVTVLLVHGDEWTWAEVAELLDVSVSTVQKHLERGMAKLREGIGVPQ